VKQIIVLLLVAGLVGATAVAPASAESAAQDVAYGTGSVLTTLVYAPFKATFCILGGVTSGFTFPFAGADTAGKVATAGCGGTWAITPGVLKGQDHVNFVGGQPPPPPARPPASQ
jgi:hypothetical protein